MNATLEDWPLPCLCTPSPPASCTSSPEKPLCMLCLARQSLPAVPSAPITKIPTLVYLPPCIATHPCVYSPPCVATHPCVFTSTCCNPPLCVFTSTCCDAPFSRNDGRHACSYQDLRAQQYLYTRNRRVQFIHNALLALIVALMGLVRASGPGRLDPGRPR